MIVGFLLLLNVDGLGLTVWLLCACGVDRRGVFLVCIVGDVVCSCFVVFPLHGLGRLLLFVELLVE